jgi:hypothetical protein
MSDSDTEETENNTDDEFEDIKKFFKEWTKADVIQGLILTVGAAYCIVTVGLWCATRQSNQISAKGVANADRNFRVDERAWIGFGTGGSITFTVGRPFLVPTEITNTGKTPAKNVEGNVAVDIVNKGVPIDFSYGTGHANYRVHGGTLFPNGKIDESFEGIQHGPTKAEPIIITKPLAQKIMTGQAFVIIHGKITYRDEFGTEHWTTFCRNVSDPSAISEDCTRDNDTDDNQ